MTIRSKKAIEITTDAVCPDCNHHWMSDLETWASPLLKPMLKGETQGLSVEQQVLVAQWATKTAMALDQTYPIEERVFSLAQCKQLMDGKLPPPGFGIQLARYVGDGDFLAMGHNDLYRRAIPVGTSPGSPDGHRTAIRIDQLIFEVNVTSDAHLDLRAAQVDVRELILPIWPSVNPIAWPPRIVMSDATWTSFMEPDLPGAQRLRKPTREDQLRHPKDP
ncbi:MAG TPA: hypothetical protein VFR48_03280 [Solirubrobacteraceae bacterium]|nr:hypothetical protein [Solirubrobacteraceae bacterium]